MFFHKENASIHLDSIVYDELLFSNDALDWLLSSLLRNQAWFCWYFIFQEAYVKALGKGFSALPFSTFTIKSRNSEKKNLYESRDSDPEVSFAAYIS